MSMKGGSSMNFGPHFDGKLKLETCHSLRPSEEDVSFQVKYKNKRCKIKKASLGETRLKVGREDARNRLIAIGFFPLALGFDIVASVATLGYYAWSAVREVGHPLWTSHYVGRTIFFRGAKKELKVWEKAIPKNDCNEKYLQSQINEIEITCKK